MRGMRSLTPFKGTGFSRSFADPNLYIHKLDGLVTVIVLYVDDLMITGIFSQVIKETKQTVQCECKMIDMGLLHFFLGGEVWEDASSVYISQKCYVKELLEAFGVKDSCVLSSLMDPNHKLVAHDGAELANATLYK